MKPCCATCNKCIKTPYDIPQYGEVFEWHCSDEILSIDDPYYDVCQYYSQGEEDNVGSPIKMEDPYDTWR